MKYIFIMRLRSDILLIELYLFISSHVYLQIISIVIIILKWYVCELLFILYLGGKICIGKKIRDLFRDFGDCKINVL